MGTSFDLHVLSTPPAFILSQDQTLKQNLQATKQVTCFILFECFSKHQFLLCCDTPPGPPEGVAGVCLSSTLFNLQGTTSRAPQTSAQLVYQILSHLSTPFLKFFKKVFRSDFLVSCVVRVCISTSTVHNGFLLYPHFPQLSTPFLRFFYFIKTDLFIYVSFV